MKNCKKLYIRTWKPATTERKYSHKTQNTPNLATAYLALFDPYYALSFSQHASAIKTFKYTYIFFEYHFFKVLKL